MTEHGGERGEERQRRMNTQNRSLSDIAERSQSGLPRRGMRTGSASRAQPAREAAAVFPPQAAPSAPAARRPVLPEPFGATGPGSDMPDMAQDHGAERNATADPAPKRADVAGVSAPATPPSEAGTPASRPEPRDAVPQPRDPGRSLPAPATGRPEPSAPPAWDVWASLKRVPLDPVHLDRHRMISARREDPSHAAFDVLRTRLVQALVDNGWRKVAITSPTKNCGKSFIAANLALSLSRAETRRTLLLDMDLRNPSLAKLLGVRSPGPIGDLLRDRTRPDLHVVRFDENALGVGSSLALALNDRVERDAAELMQAPEAAAALARMDALLQPDVVLYDLPPALYHDDVLAFRGQYDAVLLVVGGGITKPDEVTEVSRRLSDHTPLLGVVLNRAEGPSIRDYSY